jgi:hypothetical protein
MGKKSKGDRKTKSGRHEEEEDDDEYMPDMSAATSIPNSFDDEGGKSDGVDRIGQNEKQIDFFQEGVENLDNKKSQSRITALRNIINSLQSGADLFDRVYSNIDAMTEKLKRLLTRRSSSHETVLTM